jgi:hypothetical protein
MPRRMVRSVRTRLRFAVVLLSATVFLWGSHAKLSLYEAPSPERSATVAKIIEGKKPTSKIEVSATNFPKNLPESLFVLATASSILVTPAVKGDTYRVGHYLRPATYSYQPSLFVRPPPLTL